jgi:transglutaminase-like putative cysteine protease
MAKDEDPEAPGSRLGILIGLLVAELAATAAFGRVYQGREVTLKLCLVAMIATAIAGLLLRQNIILSTFASIAGLLLTIGLIVFPDTTHFLLPTMRTLRAARLALGQVGRDANVTVAPAIPLRSLMLAGVTAVWTAAFAAHSLAFRARSPLLALTPLAALLAFAGVVVDDGARPGYVLLFMLGALILLFGDAMRRLGQWGPITSWRGRRRFAARTGTAARGAWRVALGTLGVALFVPWLLPGLGAQPVLNLGDNGSKAFSLNPIDDIRPRLIQNPHELAFTVRTSHPTYWRTNTLDTFDGTTWRASNKTFSDAVPIPDDGQIAPPSNAPLATQGDKVFLNQQIQFANLTQPWLPLAPNPIALTISDGSPKYDPQSGTVTLGADYTHDGTDLSATSELIVPTAAELAAIPNIAAPNDPYTELPKDLPPQIRTIAHDMTAGAITPYAKIMVMQQTLKGWIYDQHVKPDISNDALLRFLLQTHRGYCQQYAGAMAVMLRALGYPTRVAVGFTSGQYDPKANLWRVTGADAHTWVEVRFPGYGWLAFDPTPTKANVSISRYDAPSPLNITYITGQPPVTGGKGSTDGTANTCVANPKNCDPRTRGDLFLGQPGGRDLTPSNLPTFHPTPHRRPIGFTALGIVALLVLIGLPLFKVSRRRWARRRGHRGGGRVLAEYTAVLDAAADVGFGRRPWETPEEYRARLVASVPFSDGDFDALTLLAERAAYAGGAMAKDDEAEAVERSRRAAREIRRAAGPIRSLTGAYRMGRPVHD